MKNLIFIILIMFLVACNVQQTQNQPNIEVKPTEAIYGLDSFVNDFIEDAESYNITVAETISFYTSPETSHVSCYNENIVFSESLWNRVSKYVNSNTSTTQYIKAMVYKGIALCVLKQEARTGFNKYPDIVPVPDSLTYKNGVASSWLEDYCYNDNGFGIYSSINGCEKYYQKSFWDGYIHELFTKDKTLLLKQVEEFRNSI